MCQHRFDACPRPNLNFSFILDELQAVVLDDVGAEGEQPSTNEVPLMVIELIEGFSTAPPIVPKVALVVDTSVEDIHGAEDA